MLERKIVGTNPYAKEKLKPNWIETVSSEIFLLCIRVSVGRRVGNFHDTHDGDSNHGISHDNIM